MLVLAVAVALVGCDDDPASEDPPDPDPPVVAEAIDGQTIEADEEPRDFDLEPVFDDPTGEGLDYSAASSDLEVVEVSVAAATLTVEPEGGGEATVTIEAENEGGTAETSFDVEVLLPDPPDRPN